MERRGVEAVKRYNLRFMFAAITVLIVFLGFSQWRRYRILRQVKELKQLGARVSDRDNYLNVLWPDDPSIEVWVPKSIDDSVKQRLAELGYERNELREAARGVISTDRIYVRSGQVEE
jgi:hypothetical protein